LQRVFNSLMLHVLRVEMVINSPWMLSKNWLAQKQMAFGKDISNPFMADNLPKILWFSTHHVTFNEHLASLKANGSCDSPLLGINIPRSDEDRLKLIELMIFLLQKGVYGEIGITAAHLSSYYCQANFWNSVFDKRSGDVTRLQALVDKKKIVISEDVIREILQLNDAEGVICLPNEEIFTGLAKMGYEKPSTKLTFYKAFFSSQWKILIHTILQSLSTKRTSWNEFSTAMASAVICLSKGLEKFSQGLRHLFLRDVAHVATPSPPSHGIPSPPQEPSSPPQQPHVTPPALTQGEAFPATFQQIVKLKARVKKLEKTGKVKSLKLRHLRKVGASRQVESSDDMKDVFNQGRIMNEDEGIELVVTTAKLITEVVTAAATQGSDASATIPAVSSTIPAAAPTVVAAYTRRRKGVIIRDPEEELSMKTHAKTPVETPKVKDKGKCIMIEAPKPMKKKDQIEMDAEYARKL
nr:hypothetical protein [Tanacetum cinerariifolium]